MHYQRRVKQCTVEQRLRRNAYAKACQSWNALPDNPNKQAWNNYAESHPITNKAGKSNRLTGFNHYIHINIARIFNALSPLLMPPE